MSTSVILVDANTFQNVIRAGLVYSNGNVEEAVNYVNNYFNNAVTSNGSCRYDRHTSV
jgi:hypothetical protein